MEMNFCIYLSPEQIERRLHCYANTRFEIKRTVPHQSTNHAPLLWLPRTTNDLSPLCCCLGVRKKVCRAEDERVIKNERVIINKRVIKINKQ